MSRHYCRQRWSSVLAAVGISSTLCASPVLAGDHGQKYDVVQGYIIQGQCQSQGSVACQTPTASAPLASGQNQGPSLGLSPSTPQTTNQTVTLQLTPAPAATQTLQLTAAPAQVQTLALTAAPAQVQTLSLAAAPAQVQTLALTAAPAQVQTLQLTAMPVQTLQLSATPAQPQCAAIPVTLLLPRHKCHWFCKHRN